MATRMTYAAHIRAMLTLGVPLIGSALAQFAIGLTDTVMIGWYGVTELAALVVAEFIFFTFLIVGSGFAFAVMPLVAAAVEAGDSIQVRRVTRMGLWVSLAFAGAVLPVLLLIRPLFTLLGQTPEVAGFARAYLDIVAWGLIPALVTMLLRSYLSALERTQILLWVTLAAVILNAGLNALLIFGTLGAPKLGIRGAAIGSILTNIFMAAFLALYAVRKEPDHALFVRLWRPDRVAMAQVFWLGWPIGLTNLAEVGLFSASAVMMGWIGALELAAHGIALQVSTAAFMFHIGLSQAATVRAGRAYGRRDTAHLRRGAIAALMLSVLVSLVTVAILLLFPEPLVLFFLDPADPARDAIVAFGVTFLIAAALFQTADGAQAMALGLLRGVQDTRVPMLLAAVSYWAIGAPTAWLLAFPMGLGGVGIWLGLVLGLSAAGVLMLHRFWRRTLPLIAARPTD